jgi:hypothetical protein
LILVIDIEDIDFFLPGTGSKSRSQHLAHLSNKWVWQFSGCHKENDTNRSWFEKKLDQKPLCKGKFLTLTETV